MIKPKKKAKRNPADLTGRNNRARSKDIERINQYLKAVTLDIVQVFKRLDRLEYYKSIGR